MADATAGPLRGWLADPRCEGERAAGARSRLDTDLAAHQLDELARDGQAEAGAAVAARGRRVGLGEGLEQATDRVARDPDAGVADIEAHVVALAAHAHG